LGRLMREPLKLRKKCVRNSNKSDAGRKERVQDKAKVTQHPLRRAICPMETILEISIRRDLETLVAGGNRLTIFCVISGVKPLRLSAIAQLNFRFAFYPQ
jgi:hypothetical protein